MIEFSNFKNSIKEIGYIRKSCVITQAKEYCQRKINTYQRNEVIKKWKDSQGKTHRTKTWEYIYREPTLEEQNERYNDYINRNLKYIYVKVKPDDSLTAIPFSLFEEPFENSYEYIQNLIPKKYREHFIGINYDIYTPSENVMDVQYCCVYFDEEYQEIFNEEYNKYIKDKAEWCSKYGCD